MKSRLPARQQAIVHAPPAPQVAAAGPADLSSVDEVAAGLGNQAALQLLAAPPSAPGDGGDGGAPMDRARSGFRGAGQAVPYRAEMEQAFGADFSGVQAHVGAQAQASAQTLGATAYTVGQDVAFAEANPSREVVAHELTHVVQQGGGAPGVQALGSAGSGVSSPASGAEQEARAVASRVATGQAAGPVQADPAGGIQRANPSEITDSSGTATTTHAPPGLSDAANPPDTSHVADEADVQLNVRVLHEQTDPLEVSGSVQAEQLYEVVSTDPVCMADPGVECITHQIGSVSAPEVSEHLEQDSLYIGGAPAVNDIQQAGMGTCYMLASVTNVVAQDPGQIQSMISGSGAAVTFSFFRYDSTASTWVPVSITVDNQLARDVDTATGDVGGLHGASFLVAEDPHRSAWWAEAGAGMLTVGRDDWFEGALWAPLFEKAYASYAETYGQYGGYDTGNAGASGYERVEGGVAQYSYLVIYGNDADEDEMDMNWAPGSDLVATNLPAIENLLRVMGEGMASDEQFMMTAMISPDSSVERLGTQVDAILAMPSSHNYRTFSLHMLKMQQEIATWRAAPAADKDTKREKVVQRATHFATPGNWPLLHYDNTPAEYRELNELCNIVMNLGSDSSPGQRHVYAWHSYSVLNANFRDTDGNGLAVTLSNLPTQAPQIDAFQSSVLLRNPHGTNEPNPHGGAQSEQDGTFSMTLDQFFRSFATQQFATVDVA